jgi:hypothetical protein
VDEAQDQSGITDLQVELVPFDKLPKHIGRKVRGVLGEGEGLPEGTTCTAWRRPLGCVPEFVQLHLQAEHRTAWFQVGCYIHLKGVYVYVSVCFDCRPPLTCWE